MKMNMSSDHALNPSGKVAEGGQTFKTVGHSAHRKDAKDKLTGAALYPHDLVMPDMLYGATLRSTVPHAYFTLDCSKAETAPGVILVLTAKDVTGHNRHGVLFKDHEVFSSKKVKRVGDPLALVIAHTEAEAIAALKYIEVSYDLLPGVFDPEEALKPFAPKVHEDTDNLIYHYKCRRGDVQKGFEDSFVTVEQVYDTPFVDHAFLQPESGIAYVESGGRVVVKVSTQYPHFDRIEVAEAIGYEEGDIVIDNPIVGGSFGGREDLTMQAHLALATIRTGKPVKITYSREESFYAHSKRHPVKIYMKTGADQNGKLMAMEARLYGDSGAYASWAINVMRKAGVHCTGPYVIPNVHVDSYAVYTNNPYSGAMRGFGATQVPVAYEQQMDLLAEKLGISPFEIRMRNIFREGSQTANGQVLIQSVPLETCLKTIWDAMEQEVVCND